VKEKYYSFSESAAEQDHASTPVTQTNANRFLPPKQWSSASVLDRQQPDRKIFSFTAVFLLIFPVLIYIITIFVLSKMLSCL
jgi:hypothetical protein